MDDLIIKDSSIWTTPANIAAAQSSIPAIKMGIVRDVKDSTGRGATYLVEVDHFGRATLVTCTVMTRFGGVTNYEEYGLRHYRTPAALAKRDAPNIPYQQRIGDIVLVACLNGNFKEGVILGGIKHPARSPKLKAKELAYVSEFNGIETQISKTGGFKIINKKLIPSTIDLAAPGKAIPKPSYDKTVGGTYLELDDKGGFTVNDAVGQSIKIDKAGKKTTITSKSCIIKLESSGTVTLEAPNFMITNKTKTELKTAELKIQASKSASLKAPKIAIGSGSFELIDGLIKLVDALGALTVISPNGPCNPLQGAAQWSQVMQIKNQLTQIKGSL